MKFFSEIVANCFELSNFFYNVVAKNSKRSESMTMLEVNFSKELPKELEKILIEESRKTVQLLLQQETPWAFKDWLTLRDAQSYLGVSWQTLNQWRQLGLRVSEMSPRNIFVHKEELNRFIKEYER